MAKFKLWNNENMINNQETYFNKGFDNGSPVYADVLNTVLYESTLFTQGVLSALNIDQSLSYGITDTTPDNTNVDAVKNAILKNIPNIVNTTLTNTTGIREISPIQYGDDVAHIVDDGYIYLAIETFTPISLQQTYIGGELIKGEYYYFRTAQDEESIETVNATPGTGNNELAFTLGSTTKSYTINKTLKSVYADNLSTTAYQTIPGLKAEVLNTLPHLVTNLVLPVGVYNGNEISVIPTGLEIGVTYCFKDASNRIAGIVVRKELTIAIVFGYVNTEIPENSSINLLPLDRVYNNIEYNGSIKLGGNN